MSSPSTTPDRSDAPPRPRRRWRWWHVLLAVTAALGLWLAAAVGLLVASLAGGLDVFGGDRPRDGDAEVVVAREAASRELEGDAARLTADVITPVLGEGTAPLGRGEVAAPCHQGQHNWKIDDDFDLACDLQRVEVVGTHDKQAFRATMVSLDAALREDGWVTGWSGMDRVLVDYWDSLAAPSPQPGTRPSTPDRPDGYSMDDLPSAQYSRTTGGRTLSLVVHWAEPGSSPLQITYAGEWSTFRRPDGREVGPADLVAAIPADGYAVVVTESVEYFRQ